MSLLTSIPGGIKFLGTIRKYDHYAKDVEAARAAGDPAEERRVIADCTAKWAQYAFDCFDVRLEVKGRENIPEQDGYVIISNHQGYLDILAIILAFSGHQTGFIAKAELQKIPYIGRWIGLIRGLFMVRGNARESLKVMKDGAELVKQGYNLTIFPEGTRSRSDEMGPFKPGSFKLATKAKAPVVPVTIHGSYRFFEIDKSIHKGITIQVVISPVIETKDLDRKKTAEMEKLVPQIISFELKKLLSLEAKAAREKEAARKDAGRADGAR